MTDNPSPAPVPHMKTAWIIYTLLAAIVVLILVFVVARDTEEMLFYGLMGSAVAYVFRPTEKFMLKQIARFAGRPDTESEQ